jgi:hypothetical protein
MLFASLSLLGFGVFFLKRKGQFKAMGSILFIW